MKIYSFETKQSIPISITEAWEFFSKPANLQKMTPSKMGFEITSKHYEGKMFSGQIISYIVKPLAGIPLTWVTEITHVQEPFYFVDEQRFGPYAFWHHKHFLKEIKGGVEMIDHVHYALPLGILGRFANTILVENQLKQIFDFRFQKMKEIFGEIK